MGNGKWKCPKCEIWVDPPKTSLCTYCLEERDKCQECGGTRYHLGDCSKRVALIAPVGVKGPGWPCIVCGGQREHLKVEGEVVCHKVKSQSEFPCKDCEGIWRHWSTCPKLSPTEAQRIETAQKRIMGFNVH